MRNIFVDVFINIKRMIFMYKKLCTLLCNESLVSFIDGQNISRISNFPRLQETIEVPFLSFVYCLLLFIQISMKSENTYVLLCKIA